jgi:hypothetical protein
VEIGETETVRDVARRILEERDETRSLAGVLGLSFWGCRLAPDVPFRSYQLPAGAVITTDELARKAVTVRGEEYFAGEADTVDDLRRF